MSYQVLARKYRPQAFSDVIGQIHVTQTLQNALAASRIHHAYLFTGTRGVGKTTVARLLAKALNCEKGPCAEPCTTCVQCRDITAGTSLDIQEIDGASNTGVDDVREIRDRIKFLPSSARYKVYIIDEVHMLSTSAFNALLKTLEEPPAHVVFIFATTEAHKIPATILSRCQRYDFRRLPVTQIADTLRLITRAENITASDGALILIAREAEGSMRDGLSLLDQAIAFSQGNVNEEGITQMLGFLDRALLFDLTRAIIAKDAARTLSLFQNAFARGVDVVRFASDILEMLRHLLVIKTCGNNNGMELLAEELTQLTELSQQSTYEELQHMFRLWYEGATQVARTPFPQVLLEVVLLRLCHVQPVKPIGELISKVESLLQDPGKNLSTQNNAVSSQEGMITQDQWLQFQRWLVVEEPRVASILQHGVPVHFDGHAVTLRFSNALYADMLTEPDRKKNIDALIMRFFKQPVMMCTECDEEKKDTGNKKAERKQKLTQEALSSSAVKNVAEIFGAEVYDVKTTERESS